MLVTVAELRQKLNGMNFTEGQKRQAEDDLAGLQETLEVWLNRPVEPVVVTEHITTDATGFARLSVTPVIEIHEIRHVDGTTLDKPTWADPLSRKAEFIPLERRIEQGHLVMRSYSAAPGGIRVAGAGTSFSILYVGGLSEDTIGVRSIKRKILEIAARSWSLSNSNAVGLRDGQPVPADAYQGPPEWTMEELIAFDRHRRRVAK